MGIRRNRLNDRIVKRYRAKDRVFTISNLLSVSRVFFLIPIIYFLFQSNEDPSAIYRVIILIFVAGLTDFFDGMLARKLGQETELGKIIDPIADKICVVGLLVFTAFFRDDFPMWFLLVVVLRDGLILVGGIYVKRKYTIILPSNMLGKISVNVVVLLYAVFLLKDVLQWQVVFDVMLWITVGFLAASFLSYLKRLVEIRREIYEGPSMRTPVSKDAGSEKDR